MYNLGGNNTGRKQISVPDKLLRQLDAWNKANEFDKINFSAIASKALQEELLKRNNTIQTDKKLKR